VANRVLLAGVGRSGTTWSGRILGCAADTVYMNEPDNIGITHADGPQVDTLGFGPYPVLRAGQQAPQYAALWRMAWAGRLPMRVGVGRSVARLGLRLPTAVRDPLLTAFAKAVEGTRSAPRNVVVKSTMTPFALDWIVEQFNPRVVIIQRNPLNVVSSWLDWKKFITRDLNTRPAIHDSYVELVGSEPPKPGTSHLALTTWCVGLLTTVLAHRVRAHPEWHLITHETLCEDPSAGFRRLFADLELTWTAEADRFLEQGYLMPTFARPEQSAVVGEASAVTKEQPNRWKTRLTGDQVDEIRQILDGFPTRGWVQAPDAVPAG
jgi:Sulfotransferase family